MKFCKVIIGYFCRGDQVQMIVINKSQYFLIRR